mmetsp:Transcript_112586/g.363578  ORF Transcript_112586/g.363578 Transcript_112586/m.363578 type:complete len:1127 (+) Transcript_112586:101-3481(+)
MLSSEPFDGESSSGSAASCVTVRILRTDEQLSLMMQRFTAYVIQVSDFGRTNEVSHRYGDFEALHRSLLTECPGVRLPPMPPKGVDGTDVAVIKSRKGELEKMLQSMLANPEVLLEKSLHLWKFLDLPNPTVIATRFVSVPRSRASTFRTLGKLVEPKYKDDVFRLGHPAVVELLAEGLRELRQGDPAGGHWVQQQAGRTTLCQLLGGALASSETARSRLLESDVVAHLLALVERDETALDDARVALNVIVAREADRLDVIISAFLRRGGLSQLAVLVQRERCQEFVAKLLWLSWESSVRTQFAAAGGQGLRILQALLRSTTPTCGLLGAVLLAGLVASGDFDNEPSHRVEAIRLVRESLSHPDAASDPQFAKTLCGANSALVRLAGLLEDAELAPLVLGLLCIAKPQPAKLSRISGNLAAIVSDKGGVSHSEDTKARAAELLLHVQSAVVDAPSSSSAGGGGGGGGGLGGGSRGSFGGDDPFAAPGSHSSCGGGGYPGGSISDPLGARSGGGGGTASGGGGGGGAATDLVRCEGISEHEASLDGALRRQLEDGVLKSQQTLQLRGEALREAAELTRHRLRPLPLMDFHGFDQAFSSFKIARDRWESKTRESEALHHDMERQLIELRSARPSHLDPNIYKERLVSAERIYTDVKTQRELVAAAEADAREKQARADSTSSDFRRASDQVRSLEEEIRQLTLQKSVKETEATKLRHKANTPSLEAMKQQAAQSIERSLQQAKEVQVIGQRVQQGDPDYLREGEGRDQKIAELAAKLSSLKKQHQVLVQQQKDLDFDPIALSDQASRLESEALDFSSRADQLELRRMEADRERAEKISSSSIDSQDAKSAQDRRMNLASQLANTESEARRQINLLQPMIQEHHAGWQRLLAQQKKLDADQTALTIKLDESTRSAENEALTRVQLAERVDALLCNLHDFRTFLQEAGGGPTAAGHAPVAPPASASAVSFDIFGGGKAAPSVFDEDPAPLPRALASTTLLGPPQEPPLPIVMSTPTPVSPAGAAVSAAAVVAPPLAAAADLSMGDDFDDFNFNVGGGGQGAAPPLMAAPPAASEVPAPVAAAAAPALAMAAASDENGALLGDDDDFDAFLREDAPAPLAPAVSTPAGADEL